MLQNTDHEMISRVGNGVWRGAGIAGYEWDYSSAVGKSDRLFYYCTQTENYKHFD
jgi:hypothetical protein